MGDLAPVELRSASIRGVNTDGRIIDLIAVPYDTWAAVEYQGRLIEESVAPGAFGRVDKRAAVGRGNWTVNIDHDPAQWVGRVASVDPENPDGLRAELLIRSGDQFAQVLRDAVDGMYAASVGMAVRADGQEWTDHGRRRRVTNAYLDHIALTPTPAYAGTEVLAVRSSPTVSTSATPNLDRILADRARAGLQFGL